MSGKLAVTMSIWNAIETNSIHSCKQCKASCKPFVSMKVRIAFIGAKFIFPGQHILPSETSLMSTFS